MSLFGLMGGDFDDDIFGNHMNAMNMQMRSMNRLMNSFMPDPFNMLAPFDPGFQQNALMERAGQQQIAPMGGLFGFPAMPNMNRLLSADIGSPNGSSFCSSSVITMSSGPDGRPQIYQATSSTKAGPGGIRETRKTVQDSSKGIKKMAIGHHIGDRAHVIEKEQDLRSGQLEERQEFINLEEDDAEQFDREFTNRARMGIPQGGHRMAITNGGQYPRSQVLSIEAIDDDEDDDVQQRSHQQRQLPALPAPPQNNSSISSIAASTAAARDTASPISRNTTATTPIITLSDDDSSSNNHNNNNSNNNNNNNYLNSIPSRRAYRSHLHHLSSGVNARRPLRTPSSSPLATTPTHHNHSTATSPSVHPHPYNAAAARRNHRSKHSKQHQKPHATQNPTDASTKNQSRMN